MKSLIDILRHPYLLLNRVAERIYPDAKSPVAAHQRLRSRRNKIHFFELSDYEKLRDEFSAFADELDQIAQNLEALNPSTPGALQEVMHITTHPWVKKKLVLTKVAEKCELTYYTVYDGLRGKNQSLPKKFVPTLAREYTGFAGWLRKRLERAEKEKEKYRFGLGKGGAGHRKKRKKK
ncbi:MAG: hypothetical protein R3B93_21070 [Bacteroidia bacterium]